MITSKQQELLQHVYDNPDCTITENDRQSLDVEWKEIFNRSRHKLMCFFPKHVHIFLF